MMGMFDSLYEGERETYDVEWQTKAYYCNLDRYHVGDEMPDLEKIDTYQVEILGGHPEYVHSLATVVDGVLVAVDNERAHTLPLFNYSGHQISEAAS